MSDLPRGETLSPSSQETQANLTVADIQNIPTRATAWIWQNFLKRLNQGESKKSAMVLLQKEFKEYKADPRADKKPIPLLSDNAAEIAVCAQELQDYISAPGYKLVDSQITNKYFPELPKKIDSPHTEFINFETIFDKNVEQLTKILFSQELETRVIGTAYMEELINLRKILQKIKNDSLQLWSPFPKLGDKMSLLEELSKRADELRLLIKEFQKKIKV